LTGGIFYYLDKYELISIIFIIINTLLFIITLFVKIDNPETNKKDEIETKNE